MIFHVSARLAAVVATGFASALVIGTPPARAADLRISHQWPAQIDARDRAVRVLAAEAHGHASSLNFSVHPQSALGFAPERQFDAMIDGSIEMAILPLFYLSQRFPELSITLMPGVPSSVEQAPRLKRTEFHRLLQAFCESKGFHIVTWWWLAGGIIGASTEIPAPDDFKGLSVRGGDPTFDVMFESLGAIAQAMPSTQIAANMKAGKLELALASLETLMSLKLTEVAKSAIIGGPALYLSLQPLIISMKAWSALSDVERRAIETAAESADAAFEASQRGVAETTAALFTKSGARVRPMTYDEYETWVKIANDSSWAAYRRQGATSLQLFTAMLQSMMASAPAGKP